jgi:hypothetical protein
VKISDFGIPSLRCSLHQKYSISSEQYCKSKRLERNTKKTRPYNVYRMNSIRSCFFFFFPFCVHRMCSALLWSAPEIIRDAHAPSHGTQKADIYSLSIILHEIIYRRGVFAINDTSMTADGIVQSIKLGSELRPPFLGDNTLYEIGQLMKRCWQENPTDRPDTTSILNTIKKLNKFQCRMISLLT